MRTEKDKDTRTGVIRNPTQFWKDLVASWDQVGYQDIMSTANRGLIRYGKAPVVDAEWVAVFPEDKPLMGQVIEAHHIQGLPIQIGLAAQRHETAHDPKKDPNELGQATPVTDYAARQFRRNNPDAYPYGTRRKSVEKALDPAIVKQIKDGATDVEIGGHALSLRLEDNQNGTVDAWAEDDDGLMAATATVVFEEEHDPGEYGRPNTVPYVDDVEVAAKYKRVGVASALYVFIESSLGVTLHPSGEQTDAGQSLWSQPNRPFGNKARTTEAAPFPVKRVWDSAKQKFIYVPDDGLADEGTAQEPQGKQIKRFVTMLDERVCFQCKPLHGMEIDEDEEFPVGDPPIHKNCRCAVAWLPAEHWIEPPPGQPSEEEAGDYFSRQGAEAALDEYLRQQDLEEAEAMLDELITDDATRAQAEAILDEVIAGDEQAKQQLADIVHGKAPEARLNALASVKSLLNSITAARDSLSNAGKFQSSEQAIVTKAIEVITSILSNQSASEEQMVELEKWASTLIVRLQSGGIVNATQLDSALKEVRSRRQALQKSVKVTKADPTALIDKITTVVNNMDASPITNTIVTTATDIMGELKRGDDVRMEDLSWLIGTLLDQLRGAGYENSATAIDKLYRSMGNE